MYDVCNTPGGTAYRTMHKLPIVAAGKTGTSQVTSIPQSTIRRLKESELAYFNRSHAWITTYAPFDDPQYVVTVLVEHGGHGGSTSGPIAAKIYKWLYAHGYFKKKPTEEERSTLEEEMKRVPKSHTHTNPTVKPKENPSKVKHPKRKAVPKELDLF
jgi:penicillin-binding protein 2